MAKQMHLAVSCVLMIHLPPEFWDLVRIISGYDTYVLITDRLHPNILAGRQDAPRRPIGLDSSLKRSYNRGGV